MGALTVPVVTQISNHLGLVGNAFSGTELVTVMAGANDVFMNLGVYAYTVGHGGDATTAATTAVTAMGTAGATLGAYIKTQMVAKGAKHIVVLNIPDVVGTPFGNTLDLQGKAFVDAMVTTFNTQLRTSLAGTSGVLQIDAYSASKDETANPSQYGLSNTTVPACNLAYGFNALASPGNSDGSSLVCNALNVIAGDISHYLFADSVHLTPYGYKLLAQLVTKELVLAGWL
jgi:phospholipase/lecithinase/hemolysin